jgi:hypothetical protein
MIINTNKNVLIQRKLLHIFRKQSQTAPDPMLRKLCFYFLKHLYEKKYIETIKENEVKYKIYNI